MMYKHKILLGAILGLLVLQSLQAQEYKLVWEDNFDGSTLDSTKWNIETKIGIWNTGSNSEFQHYRKENVAVGSDGNGNNCLVLTAKREEYKGYSFTSGKVTTKGKFAFRRGKLEAFIKIPNLANGLWPAFWTLGYTPTGWPDCGEIDILEMGHAKGISDGVQNRFIGSHLFWGPYPSDYGLEMVADQDLSTGYYKHTLIWDESKISVYFNDAATPYFSMGITGANLEEFRNFQDYIILNLAVGGSVPGIFDKNNITASFPANMYIDWVKLYQEIGSEEVNETPALYGDFGIYEDESSVDMRMELGYDLEAKSTNLSINSSETPYEGANVLSYNFTSEQPFEFSLNSGLVRNMENYNEGSVQFMIKSNLTSYLQIGVSDTLGNQKFITFSDTSASNFLRDGKWHSIYIPLADLAQSVQLSALSKMLIIKANPAADGYISIDRVVFKETVPASGYYKIASDNPLITEGFVVDNVDNNLFIWSNTVAFNTYYPAYEGENVLSFKSTGAQAWWGFGFNSKNPLNFEAYANGYLNVSIRTTSNKEFYIGLDGASKDGVINFVPGNDKYGFKRDGKWHHLNIPFTDITASGLNLASIEHVFKTGGGGSTVDIAYDNIFYSESLPTLENSVICYAQSISISPSSTSIAANASVTLKASVINQFGKKHDSNVEWSANGGSINQTGVFSPLATGTYTITATQDNATGNATVIATPATSVENEADSKLKVAYNFESQAITVVNLSGNSDITVYNITGQAIYQTTSTQSEVTLSLDRQPVGIYIVRVINGSQVFAGQVMKR